jgi:hypothetical protein
MLETCNAVRRARFGREAIGNAKSVSERATRKELAAPRRNGIMGEPGVEERVRTA